MLRLVMFALAASSTTASAWDAFRNAKAFLSAEMQPEAVAKTLTHVEDEWKKQARAFIECELSESKEATIRDCDDTPEGFGKSCATVVSAIVQGSQGSPEVMKEYMTDVCNQDVMANWHQASCMTLANGIRMKMTASSYDNRISFQTGPVCDDFWSQFLSDQKVLHEKELVVIKAQQKEAAEAAAKAAKEAKEAAELAQKQKEEAEKAADEKEAAEIAAERQMVHAMELRANRTIHRNMDNTTNVEVEAVEEAAKKEIDEATKAEQDVVLPAKAVSMKGTKAVVAQATTVPAPQKEESKLPAKVGAAQPVAVHSPKAAVQPAKAAVQPAKAATQPEKAVGQPTKVAIQEAPKKSAPAVEASEARVPRATKRAELAKALRVLETKA